MALDSSCRGPGWRGSGFHEFRRFLFNLTIFIHAFGANLTHGWEFKYMTMAKACHRLFHSNPASNLNRLSKNHLLCLYFAIAYQVKKITRNLWCGSNLVRQILNNSVTVLLNASAKPAIDAGTFLLRMETIAMEHITAPARNSNRSYGSSVNSHRTALAAYRDPAIQSPCPIKCGRILKRELSDFDPSKLSDSSN